MRLRYLHLRDYPPLRDVTVCFASDALLNRECAIRFVVGVNGSGKSHLLRAVAEVFLALADQRPPHFPATVVYELGRDSRKRTVVLDCPGTRATSSLWLADSFTWPADTTAETFADVIENLRANTQAPHGFRPLIAPGAWPARFATPSAIALPRAVLAYTTGLLSPWQGIWQRVSDTGGIDIVSQGSAYDPERERPAGWSLEREAALPEAAKITPATDSAEASSTEASATEWRPILVTPLLLKCALVAVALPHALKEFVDYPRAEVEKFLGAPRLRELLARGGWKWPVTIAVRMNFRPHAWRESQARRARDWLLCAGEVLSEPRSTYRTLYFDMRGPFSPSAVDLYGSSKSLETATTQGEALLGLIGGFDSTAFERFERLKELMESGFIEDLVVGVARTDTADVLRFDEFSDGEQMVLGRMALFQLLENEDDTLLLLDEPETHFNDKWKREIVDIIDGAIRRTASDVLIATHSAIVLTDVFNEEIVLMERRDNDAVAHTVEHKTFASDPSELMIRIFGADDSVGQRAREYIEDLLKQADGTPADIRRIKALVERLGSGFYRSELRTLINQWERNA